MEWPRRWALAVVGAWMGAALGACAPDTSNGATPCGAGGACPQGQYCAVDDHCWMVGTGPGAGMDLGPGAPDAGSPDQGPAPSPPSTVWLSEGGGGSLAGGLELECAIGATVAGGESSAGGGGTLSLGGLSSAIY